MGRGSRGEGLGEGRRERRRGDQQGERARTAVQRRGTLTQTAKEGRRFSVWLWRRTRHGNIHGGGPWLAQATCTTNRGPLAKPLAVFAPLHTHTAIPHQPARPQPASPSPTLRPATRRGRLACLLACLPVGCSGLPPHPRPWRALPRGRLYVRMHVWIVVWVYMHSVCLVCMYVYVCMHAWGSVTMRAPPPTAEENSTHHHCCSCAGMYVVEHARSPGPPTSMPIACCAAEQAVGRCAASADGGAGTCVPWERLGTSSRAPRTQRQQAPAAMGRHARLQPDSCRARPSSLSVRALPSKPRSGTASVLKFADRGSASPRPHDVGPARKRQKLGPVTMSFAASRPSPCLDDVSARARTPDDASMHLP